MSADDDTLELTPGEGVRIISAEPGALVVEATYGGRGKPPPKHFHPSQEETFEVLEGTIRARVGGHEQSLAVGETLEVPRRAVHQMWNPSEAPARVRWTTSPAGRTEAWFRAVDSLQREGRVDANGMPSTLAFAVIAAEFEDTFRLSVGPDLASLLAIRAMAALGRRRGYSAP